MSADSLLKIILFFPRLVREALGIREFALNGGQILLHTLEPALQLPHLYGSGAIGVVFTKYYTSVGSRKLHRRINKVKLDLEHSRHRLKEVREGEYDMTRNEELTVQRVRFAKEMIDELSLRLTLADDNEHVVVENKGVAIHF